jgi:hypothetical protein
MLRIGPPPFWTEQRFSEDAGRKGGMPSYRVYEVDAEGHKCWMAQKPATVDIELDEFCDGATL